MKTCSATTQKGTKCTRRCTGKTCSQHRKLRGEIQLLKVEKVNDGKHKFVAIFDVDGKEKRTKFGAYGMSDYTIHKDIDRRGRYIQRHAKDLRTRDPTKAGYLSMFVLWNKPSLEGSIRDYKRRLAIKNFSLPN